MYASLLPHQADIVYYYILKQYRNDNVMLMLMQCLQKNTYLFKSITVKHVELIPCIAFLISKMNIHLQNFCQQLFVYEMFEKIQVELKSSDESLYVGCILWRHFIECCMYEDSHQIVQP